jgi:hypothetical protein
VERVLNNSKKFKPNKSRASVFGAVKCTFLVLHETLFFLSLDIRTLDNTTGLRKWGYLQGVSEVRLLV